MDSQSDPKTAQVPSLPMVNPLMNELILALDVDSENEAIELAEKVAPWVGAFKIGPRLVYRYGRALTQRLSRLAPVFVDNKYFDIPSTMLAAVEASFESGASLVTVHSLSGFEALYQLAKLEEQLRQERPFIILCVTVLTSWGKDSFPSVFSSRDVLQNVATLAGEVRQAGLSGLVCSAHELSALNGQSFFAVTPGIRFETDENKDQKRVMGPSEALRLGSRGLVVGRPIIEALDPVEKVQQYLQAIKSAYATPVR